jgi:arabinogalactan oligomer/maltooligosaccharide transport system substrate-binding protein
MRRSILLATTAGLALTLAACGGDATTDDTTSAAPEETGTSAPAAAGTLTVWVDETRIDAFQTLGEEFVAETGVTLDVIQKPSADIRPDFVAQAPTGEGPDLIVGAHDWVGEFVSNGVVQPVELGDKMGDFTEAAINGFMYDGQLYGVPYSIENIALVRNNALAAETPATFDELIAAKPADAEYPILIQQGDAGDAYHLYPIQTSFGAPVFMTDDTGSYTAEIGMGGEAGAAFANYLVTMSDAGAVSASIGPDQAKQAFLDGKSPYIVTGPWWTGDFVDAGLDISVLPVPSAGGEPSAPFVGVQGIYLSSQSENALLANQFLDWIATPDVQFNLYELAGRTPAMTEAADQVDDAILAGFGEAGAQGLPMPAIPEMGSVWSFWGQTQINIINGDVDDPAAAWTTMIENIEAAF